MARRIKPFSIENLFIEDAASDGRGVGRHEERVVFVPHVIPGDEAKVHVYRKQKGLLIGQLVKINQPSPQRTEPLCKHFGICGGCKWQMMDYAAQLHYKQKQVSDAFERIAKTEEGELLPILGSEHIYHYRNKLEFSFADKRWLTSEEIASGDEFEQRSLGFHVPRIYDKVINIEECHLQSAVINDIRNEVRKFAIEKGITFHNIKEHHGFLRNLMFRTSRATGELMVVLVVYKDRPEAVGQIFSHLEKKFPGINNLVWIHNPKMNSSFSELPFKVWKGKDHITEELGGYRFRISPTSFFQTNPSQAGRLYEVVRSWMKDALPEGQEKFSLVYDLYSGTGSIGIYVSGLTEKIVGIEYVESAIADAKVNASLNGLDHLNFYAGDMKKLLSPELISTEGHPDLLIIDPPRAGMDPKVTGRILEILPETIIYVSCKPATQARDIHLLKEKYELVRLQPVDMFPHTAHVENVALLRLKP